MELVHCIYCSASNDPNLDEDGLQTILDQSRNNNNKIDVTGILLYHAGSFFQVLEGDRKVVDTLYDKIEKDPRHNNLLKLIVEPIEERAFEKWTMGYPKISQKDLASIPGLNDFFTQGKSYLELEEGRAKLLLSAFKSGQWRSALS